MVGYIIFISLVLIGIALLMDGYYPPRKKIQPDEPKKPTKTKHQSALEEAFKG